MGMELMEATKPSKPAGVPAGVKPPSEAMYNSLAPEDQVLLRRLLTEPSDYMDHPEFSRRDAEKRFFGGESKFNGFDATRFDEPGDAISSAVDTGERLPALTTDQEQHLFKRYNFARKQVAAILETSAGKKLTVNQARRLIAWGHRMLSARSLIVRLNMPLVLAMAKRTRLGGIDFNELVSEGNMALLRSVEKFDCGRGFKFSTYSCRAILKSFSRVAMRASRYRGKFPAEYDPVMERSNFVETQRDGQFADCVDELKEIMLGNLAGLTEVEQTVLSERFALHMAAKGEPVLPKTLEQVGLIIGVTKERVRQIQNNALKKMRMVLEERFLAA